MFWPPRPTMSACRVSSSRPCTWSNGFHRPDWCSVSSHDRRARRSPADGAKPSLAPLFADPQRLLHEYLQVERPSQSPQFGNHLSARRSGGSRWFWAELGSWADTFAIRIEYGVCYVPVEVAQFRVLQGSFSQQSDAQPRKMLDVIARTAALMNSPEFQDRFPADYVRGWQRAYRWQVIRDYFLGPEVPGRPRPSFLIRNFRRLPRVLQTLLLYLYPGDLSCYGDRPRG